MEQRRYRTSYTLPDSGEAWNSEVGIRADNTAPDTVLSPDDPYYELAIGKTTEEKHND
jgi:hypothetical protein